MRQILLIGITLSTCLLCHAFDEPLSAQLEALHGTWFAAFEAGDGAAMDQMEMPNLILVMPNGQIIQKTEPRAGKQHADKGSTRSLESVSIRQFGNAAVLTGVLITRNGATETREPETVVFIKTAGVWKIASAHWSALPK